jgi:acetoin utilization deacetylase AcuC-like enzyme
MGDVTLYHDPLYEEHMTGIGHPERPERLPVAMNALEESGLLARIDVRSPRDATVEEIELVHSRNYIDLVKRTADSGGGNLDMDTALSQASYRAALKAAGALVESVDRCLAGELKSSFCMVRPPGHHALRNRGMGFCLFNNIAIGARYAMARKGLQRVMIVDWDAHHGNGTQDTFYDDPSVLYVSLHQYPHYPGSGWVDETGSGAGKGFTINFPFPPGTGEQQYFEAFESVIIPAGRKFEPDLVMVSAGYDSHAADLLCQMRLVDVSYRKMTDHLIGLAGECSEGRLILTLEGGYNLNAEARSIVQTVAALAGVDAPGRDEPARETAYAERAEEVIQEAGRLWRSSSWS